MKPVLIFRKHLLQVLFLFIIGFGAKDCAILPPPWANPKLNPCASRPNGWQLLYWPPDGKCYKIFKIGYPCAEDMELSPSPMKAGEEQRFSAECRCPPNKAQSARDGRCYEIFTSGPCEKNFYFAPDTKYQNESKRVWGICVQIRLCPHPSEIFYPRENRCYQKLTRGPCPKGQLLHQQSHSNRIGECRCDKTRELRDYRYHDNHCYQHFTRGPCKEKGELFLPDRSCGCHTFLPHYHESSGRCYEIGSVGPCGLGEYYQLHPETRRGMCQCKSGYIRYGNTSACYRPYTQGPCGTSEILSDASTCIEQPCERGYLYYPHDGRCYRIGRRGPCREGRIVTFDFDTRPSLDGISYNAVCNCAKKHCSAADAEKEEALCEIRDGMVTFRKKCYKLYTRGPCAVGAWIAPKRQGKEVMWSAEERRTNEGVCECVPGYTRTLRNVGGSDCVPPSVALAEYLNRNATNGTVQIITI